MAQSFNHFNQIADALPEVLGQVVRKTAFDVQAGAARRAPVDTGFLRNSIYVTTYGESTYGETLRKRTTVSSKPTKSGRPRKLSRKQRILLVKSADLLDEVEMPGDDMTAYVAVGAAYGIYVEFGTRYMPAKPYFYPAVEHARAGFESALSRIEDKLKKAAG